MIDINKKYRTRDGREVRIYATDGQDEWPIHGATLKSFGWSSECWTRDGSSLTNQPHADDLIEVRPRHKVSVWINTYGATVSGGLYSTRESADEAAVSKRTGCIKVELDFEEGEGL
jgi:hypothetical protein